MKIPEKVIEIKNSLTEDEIREEIKNFNNSNPKDAYTYLLLARNYWAIDELQSAGRMYDWIRKEADAKVILVTEHGVLCRVCKKSVRRNR